MSRNLARSIARLLAIVALAWAASVAHPVAAVAQIEDADNDGLADAGDPCPTDPRNFCYGPAAIDQTTGQAIRINAGAKRNLVCAGTRIDCNGQVWNKDFGFSVVSRTGVCELEGPGVACTVGGISAIFGCDNEPTQDIFRCEHFDRTIEPELSYTFAVPNGEYLVNLLFANTFVGTVAEGSRLFTITLEGAPVYESFDQVAAAGGSAIAVVRSAIVTVSDGVLDLGFVHVLENPTVKGIEVLRRISCLNDGECGDGDLCNGVETCADLHCIGGAAVICEPDEVCEASTGTCLERGGPCTDDGDCIGDEVCNTTKSLCQPLGGPCAGDDDCAGAEVCNLDTGTCQELGGRCEDDLDCAGAEACNLTTETCQPLGGPCSGDAECAGVEVCIDGTCGVPPVCAPACDAVCERCHGDTCDDLCANPFEPDATATTAADALFALRTAVGLQTCDLCLCDAVGNGQITAGDALAILRHALALPVVLSCPGA
jgi:hypothetical protein